MTTQKPHMFSKMAIVACICAVVAGAAAATKATSLSPQHAQPPLVLEFFAEMHIAGGYGHDGKDLKLRILSPFLSACERGYVAARERGRV